MATKISDFYEDGEEFDAVLGEAIELASSNWEVEFVAGIKKSWENYGVHAFLSSFQDQNLRRIAQCEFHDPND